MKHSLGWVSSLLLLTGTTFFLFILATQTASAALQPGTKMNVLMLMYFPPTSSNSNLLDGEETGWKADATSDGRTISWWEDRTEDMANAALTLIEDSSKYHGYKNLSAPAFFNYEIIKSRTYKEKIPRGFPLGIHNGIQNYRPHYRNILLDNNICDLVDNKGVKEVWMYGYHSDYIVPDESRMASKLGDISNSQPKEHQLPEQYRMPLCNTPYVLYNFTYQPGGVHSMGNTIHNRIHQIENVIPFVEGPDRWPPYRDDSPNSNIPGSTFWGDFSEYVQEYTIRNYNSSCGNGHNAPNWTDVENHGYKYNLTNSRLSNCETWHPDDSKTTYKQVNCQTWGCTDVGFYKWFMQNVPGYNNGIIYKGERMRNWWEAIYNVESFVSERRSLYEPLINIFTPTPKPSVPPTVTTAPTPKPTINITIKPLPTKTPGPTAVPTRQPTPACTIIGDLDCSGKVTAADLTALLRTFGTSDGKADLDNSGVVNSLDLTILLQNFGRVETPTAGPTAKATATTGPTLTVTLKPLPTKTPIPTATHPFLPTTPKPTARPITPTAPITFFPLPTKIPPTPTGNPTF